MNVVHAADPAAEPIPAALQRDLEDAERAARADPANILVAARWATLLNQAGRYPQAQKVYQALIRREPKSPELWTGLGLTNLRLGEFGQAEKAFLQSLQLQKDFFPCLAMTWIYLIQEQPERAIKAGEAAVKASGNLTESRYAYIAAGTAYRAAGKPEKVNAWSEQMNVGGIEAWPAPALHHILTGADGKPEGNDLAEHSEWTFVYGFTLWRQGDLKKATYYFKKSEEFGGKALMESCLASAWLARHQAKIEE